MTLFDIINDEIKKAMLAKDRVRLDALRGIKKEFVEAKTAKGATGDFSDDKAILILNKMVKQRKDSADIYTGLNRSDLAETEIEQMKVIQEFLPEQLSSEELNAEIKKILVETEASSMKDMGKVMSIATNRLLGRAEGKVISEIVKKLLS